MLLPSTDHHTQDGARLTEVDDGVHVYVQPHGGWCVSNAGIIVGPSGTTLIDCASTERRALALRDAVASLTPHPVRRVIVTHHHGDHHYGATVFVPEATVIAHEQAREANMLDGLNLPALWPHVQWGNIRPMEPDITFTDHLTLHVGGRPVELRHFGPAHTTGDIVAWLPDTRTLFAGDLTFSKCTPFVLMGSLRGSLQTLTALAAMNPRTIVSGHGPVSDASVLADNIRYLEWVQGLAKAGWDAGLSPLDLARQADLGEFADLPEPERLVANLHRAYRELGGHPLGDRLPLPPILADMIAFNNGAPLRCLA